MSTPTFAYTADVLRSLYDATSHLHLLFTLGLWRPSYIQRWGSPALTTQPDHSSSPRPPIFSVVGPSVWNGLPLSQRLLPRILSDTFYSSLKTLLFSRARVGSAI